MDERKKQILFTIIKEHIKTGVPVGSNILVEKYKLNISPATVRNEMVALEEEGYIIQPHTSAGRVPTSKAYKNYLKEAEGKKLNRQEEKSLDKILSRKEENNFKIAAKLMAQISNNTIFWAFERNNLYFTGVTNLFQQPEFAHLNLIYDLSNIIDSLDEIIDNIFEKVVDGENIFIGENNPFGHFCSTILIKYYLNRKPGLFGILGPLRMDYGKNLALTNYVNKKITD